MELLDQEYYEKYKNILEACIPKDVLNRLLGKTPDGSKMGDAWEPPIPPWESK